MVTYKNLSRLYARTSAGKYQLNVHEIRTGFVAAETAFDRLRRFRLERVSRVLALETTTWRFNLDGFVAHILPTDLSKQCYTQLFRDGGIEAVSGSVIVKHDERGGFYPLGWRGKLSTRSKDIKSFARMSALNRLYSSA
jgi:hypothetical protein